MATSKKVITRDEWGKKLNRVKPWSLLKRTLRHVAKKTKRFFRNWKKTVALLVFEDAFNCPVKDLLDISHHLKTASEVNAAVLTSQSHEKDPKLPNLSKMLIWTQSELDEKAIYPHINDLSTCQLEYPSE